MLSVAFFRNLNQGQRASPTSAVLFAAFEQAGASNVAGYRGNGTVIFDAEHPKQCAETVAGMLSARSPWSDDVFVRQADWVAQLGGALAARSPEPASRTEISFFDESFVLEGLPLAGVRSTIVEGGPGYAITVNDLDKEGHATPSIERLLGAPVTSRSLGTLVGVAGRLIS